MARLNPSDLLLYVGGTSEFFVLLELVFAQLEGPHMHFYHAFGGFLSDSELVSSVDWTKIKLF